jgi:hypothetical protein
MDTVPGSCLLDLGSMVTDPGWNIHLKMSDPGSGETSRIRNTDCNDTTFYLYIVSLQGHILRW